MPTHINGGGTVRIPSENIIPAVVALTGWNESDVRNEVDDLDGEGAGFKTATEHLVQLIGFQGFSDYETEVDVDGSVKFGHIEGYHDALDDFVETIAPHVEAGGFLELQSEYDDEPYRWAFDGETVRNEAPTITWPSEIEAVKEAAIAAQQAAFAGSNDDEIEELRGALDLALKALGAPSLDELGNIAWGEAVAA